MPYNPHIHHRRSIRLKGYDYAQAGLYFITLCCYDRTCLFGYVTVGAENLPPEMILNDAGKTANECWLEIPKHFPNVILHEHIVMPNHVHGIIELTGNDAPLQKINADNNGVKHFLSENRTKHFLSENRAKDFSPLRSPSKTVGSIVRGFKIGVTKWFRGNTEIETAWQRNYHEHIIRNEQSYQTIANYIINNPAKWAQDKFYKLQSN